MLSSDLTFAHLPFQLGCIYILTSPTLLNIIYIMFYFFQLFQIFPVSEKFQLASKTSDATKKSV